MSGRFKRSHSVVEGRFSAPEAELLARMLRDLDRMLGEGDPGTPGASAADSDPLEELVGPIGDSTRPPEDPAVARLLPDGYRDDDERAAEFRRFTEADLRAEKQDGARSVADSLEELARAGGGRVRLIDDETATRWLRAINDLRLVLGTRLGVTAETYDEWEALPPESPRGRRLGVYVWLGVMLETLVDALDRG